MSSDKNLVGALERPILVPIFASHGLHLPAEIQSNNDINVSLVLIFQSG